MLTGWVGSLLRSRVTIIFSAYILGISLAVALAVGGVHRLAGALLAHAAPDAPATARPVVVQATPQSRVPSPGTEQTIVRQASMQPLQDYWRFPRYRADNRFGSSSRGSWGMPFERRERNWWEDDTEDLRPRGGAYRTVCVRLCDGYYFPVSFGASSERLGRDADTCASRCGNQGRLFIQNLPNGSAEDMVDLSGRPYRQLKTAFLYRAEYVPNCKCQPDPWETASTDRHKAYALAAAARKGNNDAAKELQALQTKMREDALRAAAEKAAAPQVADKPRGPEDNTVMRLGNSPDPVPRPTSPPPGASSKGWMEYKDRVSPSIN